MSPRFIRFLRRDLASFAVVAGACLFVVLWASR